MFPPVGCSGTDLFPNSYIIDNYDNLPNNIFFIHSERYQWHNDDPDYDNVAVLQNFQLPYLQEVGYANLRCAWVLGCPDNIYPVKGANKEPKTENDAKQYYAQAFKELFPERDVPEIIGAACCAQFASTKEHVQKQPVEYYQNVRRWLIDTPLSDSTSGRILEWSWHSKSFLLLFLHILLNIVANNPISHIRQRDC